MTPISLLIVSDSDRRPELRAQIAGAGGAHIIGEIAELSALRLVAALRPEVLLLDGAASAINPLTALAWLHALPDAPRVVYLAGTASGSERRLALELGAVAVAEPGDGAALRVALGISHDLTRLGRPLLAALRAA
jgi:CheY-like chemotaxis protein